MPNAQHHVPEHLNLQQNHCVEPRSHKDNLLILQNQAIKPRVFFIHNFSQGIKHIMFTLKKHYSGDLPSLQSCQYKLLLDVFHGILIQLVTKEELSIFIYGESLKH